MQVTVDIPDAIAAKARAEGLEVETYVRHLLEGSESGPSRLYGWTPFGTSAKSSIEAAKNIRQIASRNTLGGLNIKDLMHQGHKY